MQGPIGIAKRLTRYWVSVVGSPVVYPVVRAGSVVTSALHLT